MLKQAPQYLANYTKPSIWVADSVGINSQRGNAFNHPGAGVPNAVAQDPVDAKGDAQTLLAKLAHAWYISEQLRGRFGDLVGPVRFDIAPGSTISFQGTEGAPLAASPEVRYGTVMRVNLFFDAQHQKCQTSFRLAHVRTEDEHEDETYTTATHPLYTTTWPGGVLINADGEGGEPEDCPVMIGECPEEEEEEED